MDEPRHSDPDAPAATPEDELYGTPTVPLSLVLEKALDDAEREELGE